MIGFELMDIISAIANVSLLAAAVRLHWITHGRLTAIETKIEYMERGKNGLFFKTDC